MPKSKRNKIVHLTQVKKKGKDHKDDLLKQVEQYLKEFNTVFLFDFDAIKNDRIFSLRMKLKGIGRIFAGRHSIVTMAFRSVGSKTGTNYDQFLKHVVGHKGLLFTNVACDKLIDLLESSGLPEFREKLLGYSKLPGKSDAEGAVSREDGDHDDDDDVDDDDDDDASEGGAASREVEFTLVKKPDKKSKKRQEDQPSYEKTAEKKKTTTTTKAKKKKQQLGHLKQKQKPMAADESADDDEFDDAE